MINLMKELNGCDVVPSNINYINDIPNFKMPNGILDKGVAGCGGTTFVLENNTPSIICSPRKGLIESKCNQYPFLFKVVGGIFDTDIQTYLDGCKEAGITPKIITTYDSFYKIVDVIGDNIDNWHILIDEFQFLLKDASFKPVAYEKFLKYTRNLKYVTYMSATPIDSVYLNKIEALKDLPYYKLFWEATTLCDVQAVECKSPISRVCDYINMLLNGGITDEKKGETATQMVVFLNNVSDICRIIKHCKLTKENTNVLIAETDVNHTKLSKVGFKIGAIPNKGEEHKQITLATSAYSAGNDFYHTNAITFVVSDATNSYPFEISTEMIQIAGRQRNSQNPFQHTMVFLYKTKQSQHINYKQKKELTDEIKDGWNGLKGAAKERNVRNFKLTWKIEPFMNDYLWYNDESELFEYSELAYLADVAGDVLMADIFTNGIRIKKQLEQHFNVTHSTNNTKVDIADFKVDGFVEAMQKYIEADSGLMRTIIVQKYPQVSVYYNTLGVDKIKALSYQESKLKQAFLLKQKEAEIVYKIHQEFRKSVPVSDAKQTLQKIYNNVGYKGTAKATTIVELCPTEYEIKQYKENGKVITVLENKLHPWR